MGPLTAGTAREILGSRPEADPLGYDAVHLHAPSVILRPIHPPDYTWVAEMVTDERNRETVPSALWHAEMAQALDFVYRGTICTFVIAEPANEVRLGVVSASTGEFSTQSGTLRVLLDPDFVDDPAISDGIRLFLHYAFTGWNFQKLSAHAQEGTRRLGVLRQALTVADKPIFVEEGRLRDHFVREGGFADLVTITLFRPDWEDHQGDLVPPPST